MKCKRCVMLKKHYTITKGIVEFFMGCHHGLWKMEPQRSEKIFELISVSVDYCPLFEEVKVPE